MIKIREKWIDFTIGGVLLKAVVWALFLATVVLCSAPYAQAGVIVSHTFDTNAQGWTVADVAVSLGNPPVVLATYSPTYHSTDGNPGGYIEMLDPSGNWFWFAAPTAFLGDQSAGYGGSLSFDQIHNMAGSNPDPAVALAGDGFTLYYSAPAPKLSWSHYDVPLTPTDWRVNDAIAGPVPTVLQMQAVLSNLQVLYISGDWTEEDDLVGLDNVVLSTPTATVVPEPSTWLLLCFGILAIVGINWRQWKKKRHKRN